MVYWLIEVVCVCMGWMLVELIEERFYLEVKWLLFYMMCIVVEIVYEFGFMELLYFGWFFKW